MRRLRDVGEFGLIARIERAAARQRTHGVVLGIGDDAAVLRARPGEDVVVTTDALVEEVHFRWQTQAARAIGRRALVAALSDLAAVGARPLGFTLALATPPDLALARADGLVAGLLAEARRQSCPLVGGNVSRARETSLSLAAVGAVARGRVLYRAGARVGDRILVTGVLGRSALELARAERSAGRLRYVPTPRLAAGRALARVRGVGGCIDVSDGFEADLQHLLEAAAGEPLGAEVDVAALPRPRGFGAACARVGRDPDDLVLRGGEDYELLFTARPEAPSAAALSTRLGVPVAEVGQVTQPGARRRARRAAGWRHF